MKFEHLDIVSKVKQLYHKYGIKSVTMDDVARELNVSKKTLYQCVTDKEDLVRKVIQLEFNQAEKDIFKVLEIETNALEISYKISEIMRKKINEYPSTAEYDLRKYYPEIYKDYKIKQREKMIDSFMSNMKLGISQGFFRDDLKPEIIARIQVFRIESRSEEMFQDLKDISPDDIFKEVFIYHLRGICSKKGIDYLENNILNIKKDEE
jgi:AcrR family transcriptional regulator